MLQAANDKFQISDLFNDFLESFIIFKDFTSTFDFSYFEGSTSN